MEIELVKAMLNRQTYNTLISSVRPELVSGNTYVLIHWIGLALKANPDLDSITEDDVINYISIREAKRLDSADVQLLIKTVEKVRDSEDIKPSLLLDTLIKSRLVGELGSLVTKWGAGQEVDPVIEVKELLRKYDLKPKEEASLYDIDELLQQVDNLVGVKFEALEGDLTEVPLLEKYIQPLVGGSIILLGSRTGKGKSTQVAYLAARSARSAYKYFGADRPVIIGVNEGNFRRAAPRIYQSALGMTSSQIVELSQAGVLKSTFEDVVGVPNDYIRYIPIYGWSTSDLEEYVAEVRPSMLWLDMVEHINTPTPMEESAKLKYLWEFIRYLALEYDCIIAGTAQLSVDADDDWYPTEHMVAYSKTAVQAVSELTLMMGSREGEMNEGIRGWGIVKTKFGVEGRPTTPHTLVNFNHETGMFSLMSN